MACATFEDGLTVKVTLDRYRTGVPERKATNAGSRFAFGRGFFFLLGMAAMLLLQGVAGGLRRSELAPASQGPRQYPQPAEMAFTTRQPWGEFEYVPLLLHEPGEFLPDSSQPLKSPRWYFGDCSREQLTSFIQYAGFPADHVAKLLDPSRWDQAGKGFYVSPPLTTVLEMGPAIRSRLYSILAKYGENSAQRHPFRFRPDGFDDWFIGSGLGAAPLEMVRSLIYTNDGTLCFCDGFLAQRMLSTNDFKLLVKALYGENTFLMRVRVTPESDVDAIVEYWAKGRTASVVRPLLEALAKVPGGGSVTVSYLLPPFARLRLYTFANPATDPAAERENCFWTAMNFFNEKPDPRFLDVDNTRRALAIDYLKTDTLPTYGDLIALNDHTGNLIHLCVYLADGVVFTKNGYDYLRPWVLMKIPDMMKYYSAKQPVKLTVYRAK